jgi:hypothetical protein
MLLGEINGKQYILEQSPLTKQFRVEVYDKTTGNKRTYTSSKIMQKYICMFI